MFTLKVRRRLRAQASLVDVLGSSWIFAVLAIAGIALLIGVAHAVTNGITYEHEVASVHNVVTALERDKLASQAAFVPATDLAGVSNADGHEFDLYQQGLHHNGHFFAYCFTAAAGECQPSQPLDTLAVYTYAWASLPRNGGHAPSISIYRPPSSGLTGFSVHDYFGGPALVAHFAGIAALNAKTPFASSCVPKVYHWGYPVTPAPGGYPALVSATCRAFRATLTDGRFSESIGLTDQHIPFVQTVIIGTATPTPMPLRAAPDPLHFSSPVAAMQSFQASESNYGNRVTVPAQQYSIAGCSGIAQVAPSGGSIAPSYNGSAGVTNVQVLPVVSPAPNGASCAVDVTDNTPQTTSVPVSIGDTFAPSAQGYAVNFTGSSTVAPIVTKEQNYAVGPSQGGRGGFIFRYYSSEAPTGICSSPNAANATVSSDGTLTVAQQWSVPMSGAGVCTAVFEDAYGRMFAAQVQANALAMKTWPAYLEVGANGSSLGQSGSSLVAMVQMPHQGLLASLTARVGPWINNALGGGVAEACIFCSPSPISTATPANNCKTNPFGCPTPSPTPSPTLTPSGLTTPKPGSPASCFWIVIDPGPAGQMEYYCPSPAPGATAPPPPSIIPGPCYAKALTGPGGTPDLTLANMPATIQNALDSALGISGLAVDSSGCIDELNTTANAWEPVPKFGGLAYEPSNTAKLYNIGNSSTCGSNVFSGPWQPASQTGVAALLDVVGGSTGGSCTIDLTDGSTSNPVPDAGQVQVGVVASVGCVVGTACGVNIVQRGLWCSPMGAGLYVSGYHSVETVYQSTNGGNTWTQTYTANNSLNFGHASSCGTTVAPPLPSPPGPIDWTQNNQAFQTNGSWTPTNPPTYVTSHFG